MLKEFRIKNFNSIKKEILFTMEPELNAVSEYPEHLWGNTHGDKLLKVASIYGPNAGGKTTLIKAIYLLQYLFRERYEFDERNERLLGRTSRFYIEPFKFVDIIDNLLSSTIIFIDDKYELGYSYELEHKSTREEHKFVIVTESLSYRKLGTQVNESVFERNGNIVEAKGLLSELFLPKINVSDTQLLLSHLNINYINSFSGNKHYSDIVFRLINQVDKLVLYDNTYLAPIYQRIDVLDKKEEFKKWVLETVNSLGINISNIYIEKINDHSRAIYVVHKINDKEFKLRWEHESEGTKQLILLLLSIYHRLHLGGILLVDEIDAHLHPKLISKIIQIFTSKLNINTQLIFNSHDIMNMTNELFRRDEIWFMYRDENLNSELVSLSDFIDYKGDRIRKDAKYSKQYMEGKYGADPFVAKGVLWNGEN